MRFLVMVKATADTEAAGYQPTAEELTEMTKFNARLLDEGRIELAEGLTSSAEGVRVLFAGDAEPKVIDGPFAETKELIAGFWVLNGESLEDVVALMKQAPNPNPEVKSGVMEIRPIAE
ncbi:YciI family protein [Amycolatopsis sp. FBCC-B4732]|uniref:YciI family protein n=1 Tax=Amycolatopsis sp. FBCC-B4732 TaxID=3079339 RepID=UPI001FF6999D|nr:YciI family protein [Amycolatopsis sp. FBCC-B4732]UOX87917.1 YciI family protein [Amycolatopsis sp. FBCC-B4732]